MTIMHYVLSISVGNNQFHSQITSEIYSWKECEKLSGATEVVHQTEITSFDMTAPAHSSPGECWEV